MVSVSDPNIIADIEVRGPVKEIIHCSSGFSNTDTYSVAYIFAGVNKKLFLCGKPHI